MGVLRSLHWPFVIALGVFALIRPAVRIIAEQLGYEVPASVPVFLTIAITVTWVVVVGFSDVAEPLVTLLVAGLIYGVLAIVLSAAISLTLEGELAGPLSRPVALLPVLTVNGVWGLIAGLLAVGVRRIRASREN